MKIDYDKKKFKCKAENRLSPNENSYNEISYSEEFILDVLCKSQFGKILLALDV